MEASRLSAAAPCAMLVPCSAWRRDASLTRNSASAVFESASSPSPPLALAHTLSPKLSPTSLFSHTALSTHPPAPSPSGSFLSPSYARVYRPLPRPHHHLGLYLPSLYAPRVSHTHSLSATCGLEHRHHQPPVLDLDWAGPDRTGPDWTGPAWSRAELA